MYYTYTRGPTLRNLLKGNFKGYEERNYGILEVGMYV